MQSRGKLLVAAAVALAFFGYQFLIHKVTTAAQLTPVSLALVLVPFAIGACWAIAVELGWRIALPVTALLGAGGLAAVSVYGLPHSMIAFGLPHLVTNLFLMWFFARTLRSGREPLITAIARRVHGGSLPQEIGAYTRTVTFVWSLFFAMQVLVSALLFSFASLEAWSTFINLLNGPSIVALFVGEYLYRVLLFREHSSTLFAGLQFFLRNSSESESTRGR